jgi:hypothetical protein
MKKILLMAAILAGLANSQVYPPEYTVAPTNGALSLDVPMTGYNTLGIAIDNMPIGTYNSLSLRPNFGFDGNYPPVPYPPTNWDVEVFISYNTKSTQQQTSITTGHNPSTGSFLIARKLISMPRVVAQFPNGGLNNIVAEPFHYKFTFDTPYQLVASSNIFITITAFNNLLGQFIDCAYYLPDWSSYKLGSVFGDTRCALQGGAAGIGTNYDGTTKVLSLMWYSDFLHATNGNGFLLLSANTAVPAPIVLNNTTCISRLDLSNTIILNRPPFYIPIPTSLSNQIFVGQVLVTNTNYLELSPTEMVRAAPIYNSSPGIRTLLNDMYGSHSWRITPTKFE